MVHPHRRRGARARARPRQLQDRQRRDRGLCPRPRRAGARRRAPAPRLRRCGLPRGNAPPLSLPRPAARGAPPQHDAALGRGALDAGADVGGGIHRAPDADHHRLLAGGRARLPRAVAPPPGQVLRAAAGAAAVQAAPDGGGLRPLLPDRPLLPRRGPARRPQPDRLLPARHGDELRHPGGRVRRHRAGAPRRLRGVRRRACGRRRLAAAHLGRERALVRDGQARPAVPDPDAGRERAFPRRRLRPLRQGARGGRHRDPRRPRPRWRLPRLLRPHERLRPEGRAAGNGLHLLAEARRL